MNKFEVGDLVKGLPESNIYGLTKAVVKILWRRVRPFQEDKVAR